MVKKLKIEDIHEGFSYAAVDADGFAFAYKSQPYFDKKNEVWKSPYSEDSIRMIGGGFDASDYQNSLVSREAEQKPELKKLTGTDIPDGYEYAAVDKDGRAYAYMDIPIRLEVVYDSGSSSKARYKNPSVFIGSDFDASDWQNSIISRKTAEQAEPKKLTAADIPEGYNFAAVDSDGQTYVYTQKPSLAKSTWFSLGGNFKFFSLQFDASDWQNSLVCRETSETEPAYKETNNKLSYSEIDPYFLEAMARRMNEGKKKYGPNNWKKLSDINELLDAAQRHLLELRKMMEEDFEPIPGQETDLQHCAALACNAMFIHYHLNPNT